MRFCTELDREIVLYGRETFAEIPFGIRKCSLRLFLSPENYFDRLPFVLAFTVFNVLCRYVCTNKAMKIYGVWCTFTSLLLFFVRSFVSIVFGIGDGTGRIGRISPIQIDITQSYWKCQLYFCVSSIFRIRFGIIYHCTIDLCVCKMRVPANRAGGCWIQMQNQVRNSELHI